MAKSLSSKIAAVAAPKGLLSTLEFVEEAPARTAQRLPEDPKQRVRAKMIAALDQQRASVEAMLRGEAFKPTRQVPVKGQRGAKQERAIRFSPWYWRNGDVWFLGLRFGSRPLAVDSKVAIKVGSEKQLIPVLDVVREAVEAGELDEQMLQIAEAMGRKNRK